MAIMIPSFPYGFDPRSREDDIFYSLKKLPNDYYVFYSFKIASLINDTFQEREIDFLIYNRNLGLMFIEAKSGSVWCDKGIWRYSNGDEMRDPFKQADSGRWKFHNTLLYDYHKKSITDNCKFHFAVWFPSINKKALRGLSLPQNADPNVILTREDLKDPLDSIERIFSYKVHTNGVETTNLSDEEDHFLLYNFLCPEFKILPPKSLELDSKRKRFDAMIAEQSNVLNYLELQRNAVINGAAGTGKTMIAIEKARRHSQTNETVLFLCFNIKLKEYLEKEYPLKGVSYYTIDGFACKMCSTAVPDYKYLETILLDCDDGKQVFPYDHIIVDEGQDFGQQRMHTDDIFELLEDIVLKTDNGSFYVFYDKYQMIQSSDIPSFIENADCRLTLYKNCRNTKRIAETSFRPLKLDKVPKLFDSALVGDAPVISFCKGREEEMLKKIINQSIVSGMDNIQIVSCAGSDKSIIKDSVIDDAYDMKTRKVSCTTVRKFKGLEAEHVILIDVDSNTIANDNMLFYVGASRAKLQLSIIASLDDNDCTKIVNDWGSSVKRNNPKESLAKLLMCKQFIV